MSLFTQNLFSTKLSWEKFVPDVVIILLYYFFLDPLMAWQLQHQGLSCIILMLLNIVAIGLGCYTFFSIYTDEDVLVKYKDSLSPFERATVALSGFISCLGFFWWLVPFASVKKMGVKDTGFILGATVYFVTYLGVVAKTIGNKKALTPPHPGLIKLSNTVVLFSFFFFSYAFLLMALQHWQPTFIAAPYLAIICLFIFYLPLRLFLLLRPPFHKLEYISFILSFGFLMIKVFARL